MAQFFGAMATMYMRSMLEQARESLKSAGFEKWQLEMYSNEFAVDEANLFKGSLIAEKILFTGLSTFEINTLRYDVTTSRVHFDLSFPKLFLAIGNSSIDLNILHNMTQMELKGWVTACKFGVSGEVEIQMADPGEVKANIIELITNMEQIQSKLTMKLFGFDCSDFVNYFLVNQLPGLLNMMIKYFKTPIENLLKYSIDRQFLETI